MKGRGNLVVPTYIVTNMYFQLCGGSVNFMDELDHIALLQTHTTVTNAYHNHKYIPLSLTHSTITNT